jgi:hypothetical protein
MRIIVAAAVRAVGTWPATRFVLCSRRVMGINKLQTVSLTLWSAVRAVGLDNDNVSEACSRFPDWPQPFHAWAGWVSGAVWFVGRPCVAGRT